MDTRRPSRRRSITHQHTTQSPCLVSVYICVVCKNIACNCSPIHYPAPTHLRVRSAPPLHRRRCPAVPRRAQRRAVHYSAVYIPARPRGAKPRHTPRCRPPTRPGSLELGHSCRIAAACRQGTARLVRDRGCPWRARTENFRAFKNSTRSKIRNSARSDIRTGRISACHIGRLGVARCSAPSKFKIQTLHAG